MPHHAALRAIEAIRAANGNIVGVLALVDREEGGRDAIEKTGTRVLSLVTATELIRALGS